MVDVSILIVNWNTKDFLRKCLDSIYIQTKDIEIEVFVVDNGSTDGSVEMVKSEHPHVELIINSQNLGFARANNQAISRSKGRYVLLLNSDTVVLNNTLYEIVKFMDEHPDAGIGGCKLLNPNYTLQLSCYHYPSPSNIFSVILSLFKGSCVMRKFKYDRIKEVDSVSGACLIIRRETIAEIGILDERFFLYAEESDWCLRAKRKGWKVYFIPQGSLIHYNRQTQKEIPEEVMSEIRAKSCCLFYEKNYGRLVLLLYRCLTYCTTIFKTSVWLLIAFFDRSKQSLVEKKRRYYQGVLKGIKKANENSVKVNLLN